MTASGVASGTGTIDERVGRLRGEVDLLRSTVNRLEVRMENDRADTRREFEKARRELSERIERRLSETQERYLLARRLGLLCIFVGTTLVVATSHP